MFIGTNSENGEDVKCISGKFIQNPHSKELVLVDGEEYALFGPQGMRSSLLRSDKIKRAIYTKTRVVLT